ncbi:amidohydrolase [Pseudonocardia sp. DSM 110487]|uniref:amidohydrolase family protein n=1 Tax=Pseudonocardia sp. DSM 110487 TaxID=2865833 RepID=UPI001C69F143|nr:amidohydrolase family protein [Pseudonocardia sp. DSM 110487]QYN39840.1 amidohydrolase [Pseudonocardia sp. DSM 110487]
MKVDAYSHILPAPYFERMRELAVDPGALKRWLELPALHDVDERLRMMDEFGDDYQQVLTLSSPPIELLAGPSESPALARLANESMRELCEKHPDRFPAFVASLPMNNPDAALDELASAIDDLGARGVQVFTNVSGKPLDDPAFRLVFDEMARRDLPIWMHPARGPGFADYTTEDTSKYEIWWALGWPYETSVAMARLVFSGLLERHPNIKIITHHLGAMIPYLEGRIGLGWSDQLGSRTADEDYDRMRRERLPRPLLDYFRRFYADTALSGSAIGIRCGLDFFGSDHVLFGSDCPFDPEGGPMYIRETIRVIDALDVTDEVRDEIYQHNIRRLMRLPDGRA